MKESEMGIFYKLNYPREFSQNLINFLNVKYINSLIHLFGEIFILPCEQHIYNIKLSINR